MGQELHQKLFWQSAGASELPSGGLGGEERRGGEEQRGGGKERTGRGGGKRGGRGEKGEGRREGRGEEGRGKVL